MNSTKKFVFPGRQRTNVFDRAIAVFMIAKILTLYTAWTAPLFELFSSASAAEGRS